MNPDFTQWLIEPLKSAAGHVLTGVAAVQLRCDLEADTSLESSTDYYYCEQLELEFGLSTLDVTWGFIGSLRPNNAFHIQAHWRPNSAQRLVNFNSDLFENTDISSKPPWSTLVGRAVDSISVLGKIDSPQAIELAIGGFTLVFAVGCGNDRLDIGDGDELLILTKWQWEENAVQVDKNVLWEWLATQ